MENLLTEWRFLAMIIGLALAIGEARYKLARHEKLLDPEKRTQSARDNATMLADLKSQGTDMKTVKEALDRLSVKHDKNTERLWTSLEESKEKIAKLEGRMNGAV